MLLAVSRYKIFIASAIFMLAAVISIVMQQPMYMLIPFAWILVPPVASYCVDHTERLFWILIFLIPFSTELNITASLGLDFPDEPALMLLTGLFIVKMLHEPKYFPPILKTEPLFLLLILIMCWSAISAAVATDTWLSTKFILARIWYIIPFVFVPQILLFSQKQFSKIAYLICVPMLLLVLQALLRHAFYGFSFESVKETLYPFFRNHVNYSSMLVCLLPVAASVVYLTPATNPHRKYWMVGLLIGLAGLIFSYSRGAWVALMAGWITVWLIRKHWLTSAIYFSIAFVLMATGWLLTNKHFVRFAPDHDHTIFHTNFSEHMSATIAMKDVSNAERFYRWVAGFRMAADQPWTGFGPNHFYTQYRPYTLEIFRTWVSDNPEHSTVHNYFLLTLIEQGIPGLILFSLLYFGMLLKLQYLYTQLLSRFYRTIALCIAVMLVMMGVINFMSDMIETDKVGSLFWLSLGVVFLLQTRLQEEKSVIA